MGLHNRVCLLLAPNDMDFARPGLSDFRLQTRRTSFNKSNFSHSKHTADILCACDNDGGTWKSAFVAGLFALHPLHVESVAWISERKDVLSTFFWLLTMWAYVRYVRSPAPAAIKNYLLFLLFFPLG